MRELLAFKKAPPKAVNIELFSMKTPFGDRFLLKDTDLILEANKRQALFGANATGKSLLFRNMNEGKIKDFPKHMLIHHCKVRRTDTRMRLSTASELAQCTRSRKPATTGSTRFSPLTARTLTLSPFALFHPFAFFVCLSRSSRTTSCPTLCSAQS
jgi:hypothetical protein